MLKENEIVRQNGPLTVVVDKETGLYVRKAEPDDLPKEETGSKIEIAVCETIAGSGPMSRGGIPRKESATYHVEVRFVPSPGAHSICFQGERFHNRAKAEADKAYVESVFK